MAGSVPSFAANTASPPTLACFSRVATPASDNPSQESLHMFCLLASSSGESPCQVLVAMDDGVVSKSVLGLLPRHSRPQILLLLCPHPRGNTCSSSRAGDGSGTTNVLGANAPTAPVVAGNPAALEG